MGCMPVVKRRENVYEVETNKNLLPVIVANRLGHERLRNIACCCKEMRACEVDIIACCGRELSACVAEQNCLLY